VESHQVKHTPNSGLGDRASFCAPAGWFAIDLFGLQCYNCHRSIAADRCLPQRIVRPAQVQVAGLVGGESHGHEMMILMPKSNQEIER
jgi:hypothetical protein